jgi:hypothetical protein
MEVVMKPSPSVGHLAFGGRLRRRTDGHVRGGGPTVGYGGGRQRRVERPRAATDLGGGGTSAICGRRGPCEWVGRGAEAQSRGG